MINLEAVAKDCPPPTSVRAESEGNVGGAQASKLLSVVIPCYNEEKVLRAFFEELVRVCNEHPALAYEFVFVNDGSSDATQEILEKIAQKDKRAVVIEFSRNFGKESALSAGLATARGDYVVPIDADLQHPPAVIFDMVKKCEDSGADVVIAQRLSRKTDSCIYRICTRLFYKLEDSISDCRMPRDAGDFRLMKRCVVDKLNALPEKRRFMKGLYAWVGFKVATVSYEVGERQGGESKFSPLRLVSLAFTGLLDFSTVPLRIWVGIGACVSLFAFSIGLWIFVRTLLFGVDVPGYASLFVSIVFLGGVQLLSIGILGEYIGRVYSEVKARPAYVIRRTIRSEQE